MIIRSKSHDDRWKQRGAVSEVLLGCAVLWNAECLCGFEVGKW